MKLVRWLLWLVLGTVLVVPLGLAVAVAVALQGQPLVTGTAQFSPEHIARARELFDRNDPRYLRSGVLRTVSVSQEDVDLAANFAANRLGQGSASVLLGDGSAQVKVSLRLPQRLLGRYLNIDAVLQQTPTLPRFASLRIGRLPVPALLANRVLDGGLAYLRGRPDYAAALATVKQVSAHQGVLQVAYVWNDEVSGQLRAALVPQDEQERIKAYQKQLAAVTRSAATSRAQTLSSLMASLFELATRRSDEGAGGDAVAENRAAIVVLTFYVNNKDLYVFIPAARSWPAPLRTHIGLAGRGDTAQHFTVSAMLAATSGSPLSDAVGLYKELGDSRGGSGFSFNDLAADRAGTLFGERATQSDTSARAQQRKLANGASDTDLLPNVADLPEDLQEAEFKRRFGGVGAPAYQKVMDDIERRIAALPLYQ